VILTISSAGCNVLDYLIEGPKAIVACDFNVAQLAVLELKLACIKKLTYEQFWAIWSESDYQVFKAVYGPILRDDLTEDCRSFWDDNGDLIRDNFMFAGTSGLAAKLLVPVLRFLGVTDYMVGMRGYPPASLGLATVGNFLKQQWVWQWLAPLGGVPKSQSILSSASHTFGQTDSKRSSLAECGLRTIIFTTPTSPADGIRTVVRGTWRRRTSPRFGSTRTA